MQVSSIFSALGFDCSSHAGDDPGSAFFASEPDRASLRLSFAMAEPDAIEDGVLRLKTAYQRFISNQISSQENPEPG